MENTQNKSVEYDKNNPNVWLQFQRFALELIGKGYKRIGSKMIFERIRWETMVSGDDGYKVNNNHTPYYARKFEQFFPQYQGVFSKRTR